MSMLYVPAEHSENKFTICCRMFVEPYRFVQERFFFIIFFFVITAATVKKRIQVGFFASATNGEREHVWAQVLPARFVRTFRSCTVSS